MSVFYTAVSRARQALNRVFTRVRRPARPTVQAGAGAVFSTAQLLRSNRLKKPLLVIGVEGRPWADRLIHTLEESDVDFARYGSLPPEPTVEDGEKLRLAWIQEICDCFIVLGSDRDIDLVKAAAARTVRLNRTIPQLAGFDRVRRRIPPVIAVPTVTGAGTESLSRAVVWDEAGAAIVIEDPSLVPAYAVLDPELLDHMSRPVLAENITRGLCLAVEAWLSGSGDDVSRSLAGNAVKGILLAAEPCWNSGGTMEERTALMTASQMAGEAASTAGGGYIRAISGGIAGVCRLPFGEACAVMLPAILEKYGNSVHESLARLSELAGAAEGGGRADMAAALIRRLRRLFFRISLPESMSPLSPEAVRQVAAMAAAEVNPRFACPVVWSDAELEGVIRSACAVRESG